MSDDALHHDRAYFDAMYRDAEDPWGFDSRWYERRKFALTIAALPHHRYRRGLEPGCANGALTELLAQRCDTLVAHDFLEGVVERAKQRLSGAPNVEVRLGSFPSFWPEDTGDLVIWSEIAYYLTSRGRQTAMDKLARFLEHDGVLVAVHYTGPTNYPMTGREVGRWIDASPFLSRRTALVDERFEIGVWSRD